MVCFEMATVLLERGKRIVCRHTLAGPVIVIVIVIVILFCFVLF